MLVVNRRWQISDEELQFSFARSGGPGGQNVNKLNTKAVLRWDVTRSPSLPAEVRERFVARYRRRIADDGCLVLSSQRFRSQGQNVADCRAKLVEMILSVAERPVVRKKPKVTRGMVERRLESKRKQSEKKRTRRDSRLSD